MDLIGDIGGTFARFALVDGQGYKSPWQVERSIFLTFQDAIRVYLEKMGNVQVERAAFAWAAPVVDRQIVNLGWAPYWITPLNELKSDLGFTKLAMINDAVAVAQSIPFMASSDLEPLNDITPSPNASRIIVAPGTAFGAAFSIWDETHWKHMPSDIGYSQPPLYANEREREVMEITRTQVGHLTISNLICGLGLRFIYEALSRIDGITASTSPLPFEIIDAALAGTDPRATETVEMFVCFLLRVIEGLSLTVRATGGIYMAGSLSRRLRPFLTNIPQCSPQFLKQVPVLLVRHEHAAYPALQNILAEM